MVLDLHPASDRQGVGRLAVTHQPRYWLTESLVTSHRSVATLCGASLDVEAPDFTFSCDFNQHGLKTILATYCCVHTNFGFLSKSLQTCEGRLYDSYNHVLWRRRLQCNVWWGAARSDALLITCQRHVDSNMGPFTPGTCHVIHSLRCIRHITAVWQVCSCVMEMELNAQWILINQTRSLFIHEWSS